VFVDNAGIVALANNPVEHSSNKHITVLCCYVRERVAQGIVTPLRISSQENVADIFTKALSAQPFGKCAEALVGQEEAATSLMLTRDMVEDETGEENDEEQVGPPHEPCQVYREWLMQQF